MTAPISCEVSVACKTDSSCKLSIGKTTVLVGLSGPAESPALVSNQGLIIEVSARSPSGVPGNLERLIESSMKDVLKSAIEGKSLPFAQLNVFVEILADHGSLLSVIINATILACLDLGIPLSDFPIAASSALVNGSIVASPTLTCESLSTAVVVCFISAKTGKTLGIVQASGKCPVSLMGAMIQSCQDSCKEFCTEHRIVAITSSLSNPV